MFNFKVLETVLYNKYKLVIDLPSNNHDKKNPQNINSCRILFVRLKQGQITYADKETLQLTPNIKKEIRNYMLIINKH